MCEGNDWLWLVLWLVAVHLVGLFYARRRRLDLLAHLHHLSQAATSSAAIVSDAEACKQLLSNIFPPQVLRQIEEQEQRLLQYDGEGGEGGGEGGGGVVLPIDSLRLYLLMGRELVSAPQASAGSIIGVGGLAGAVRKRGTVDGGGADPHFPTSPQISSLTALDAGVHLLQRRDTRHPEPAHRLSSAVLSLQPHSRGVRALVLDSGDVGVGYWTRYLRGRALRRGSDFSSLHSDSQVRHSLQRAGLPAV